MPTVKDFKKLAKERGLRGYSKLRKAELLSLLRLIPTPKNIMNVKNPEINVPILIPETVKVQPNIVKKVTQLTAETVLEWMNWLAESEKYIAKPISSSLKNLKEKINKILEEKNFEVKEGQSSLDKFVREFIIDGKPGYDPRKFFEVVRNLVWNILKENKNTKVKMILNCKMQRTDLRIGETEKVDAEFHSNIEINLGQNKLLNEMFSRINENLANFQRRGSNWVFVSINHLEIHLGNWKPLNGSSYIPLPRKIKNKGAIINLKNDDDQCFKWSVTRALNPADHPERITKELKDQSKRLNWDGLSFPMDLKQIKIFEKNTPEISINVFGYEESVYPLKIPKPKKSFNVDLLLISDKEKQHYCLIKSLSRLISSQVSKQNGSMEICRRCLNHFPNKKKLKIHEEYCSNNEVVKIEMPKEGSLISFNHHNRSIKVPFVFYADFEAFTEEVSTCEPNDKFSFTKQYQKHQPSGFCYKCVGSTKKSVLYRGEKNEDISQKFVEMLERDIKTIYKKFNFSKKMIPLTKKEQSEFEKAKIRWICQKEFGSDKKVRDHCHFTGKFRGAAHNICNLQFKKPKFTPVIFHNLSGYDSHLFVKNL